jgi:cysteine-rich repeat protein
MKSAARIVIAMLAIGATAGTAGAQSQGPHSPGSVVSAAPGSSIWGSPGNAAISDNMYAGVTPLGLATQYLEATDFGFSIPPAAVIDGIVVDIERKSAAGTIEDESVLIIKGGTLTGTDHALPGTWPTMDAVATYGATNDLWGTTWTPADINASDFGVGLSVIDNVDSAGVDAMSITVYYSLCGDGIVSPGEQCDDGNTTADGNCCTADCQFEPTGTACIQTDNNVCNGTETCDGSTGMCTNPGMALDCNDHDACTTDSCDNVTGCKNVAITCNDHDACTTDSCDKATGCVFTAISCDDGNACTQDSCNPATGCVFTGTPQSGCLTAQRSVLRLKNVTDDTKDRLRWRWNRGQATTLADFGTPTGTTSYTLCIYSGTSSALAYSVPGGANWSAINTKGFRYKDKSAANDGIRRIVLRSGADGKSKALVRGLGVNLPDPTLPLDLPVTAQLVNSDTTTCMTSTFSTARKNTTTLFRARTP